MFRLIDEALSQPLTGRFEPSRQDCVNDIRQIGQTTEKVQIGRDDTPFLKRSRRRRARRSIS
jgi:hypothetical protein|tara:strand:+ start:267036 stop:267221 length:186 start_codon:yes stop_codon:yes gene_type:complete